MIITVSIITLLITLCVNCLIALRSDVKRNYRKKKEKKKSPGCLLEENAVFAVYAMFLGRTSACFLRKTCQNLPPFFKFFQTHLIMS